MLKNLFIFSESKEVQPFLLEESSDEMQDKNPGNNSDKMVTDDAPQGSISTSRVYQNISTKLSENLEYIKNIYTVPKSSDVIIREFDVVIKSRVIPAFMVLIDGMIDRNVVNNNILEPFMLLANINVRGDERNIGDFIRKHLLVHNQIKEATSFQVVIDEVNFGGCGIFVDGMDVAFTADVKGWEHRNIERPVTEITLRGPQEGFGEIIRINTSLIRRRLKDQNLIVDNITIGERSRTPCCMMYIKDIANDSLVNEVRRRLEGVKVDYLLDSGQLEKLIEDNSLITAPLTIATERPDRVTSLLVEGRIAILVHGSPFALIVPITNNDLIHSAEDDYLRFPYVNFLRIIRTFAVFLSLLLPGFYIATTNYHQELIPTDLLFAIDAAREKVPFPAIIEIFIMEVAFELIREAGIRIPGPIGPTLGIIGALILGQAAVAANIVSPIMIIIVSVTGISSFAIPNYSLAFAFRIARFAYIALGGIAGLLGVTTGIFIHLLWLANSSSFGVPLLAPFAPLTKSRYQNQFLRAPEWKQEERPDYLNTKDKFRQPEISRLWTQNNAFGRDKNENKH